MDEYKVIAYSRTLGLHSIGPIYGASRRRLRPAFPSGKLKLGDPVELPGLIKYGLKPVMYV